MITALLVFISMALTDFAWSVYVKSLADDKIVKAGFFSMLIILFGAFTTITYVGNHWMLIPACIGAFVGTVMSKLIK